MADYLGLRLMLSYAIKIRFARVAELVDALDLESSTYGMGVQVPPLAPKEKMALVRPWQKPPRYALSVSEEAFYMAFLLYGAGSNLTCQPQDDLPLHRIMDVAILIM